MTTLNMEIYARVLAHVACRRGARVEDILPELGIDAGELRTGEAALREQLAGLWDNRKGIVAMKFAAALGAELARLGPLGGDGDQQSVPDVALKRADFTERHGPAITGASEPREVQVPTFARAVPAPPSIAAAPALSAEGAHTEQRRARWANVPGVGTTGEVDVSAFRKAVIPFAKSTPSPEFFAAADAARAEQREKPAASIGHETVALPSLPLPHVEGGTPPTTALPAAPDAEVTLPMTLEQYAAFCAELAVFPAHTGIIYQRYGLVGPDARKLLDDTFGHRFRADPSQQQRWLALVAHYCGVYRREPSR